MLKRFVLVGMVVLMLGIMVLRPPLDANATVGHHGLPSDLAQDEMTPTPPLHPTATLLPTAANTPTPYPSLPVNDLTTPRPMQLTLEATPGDLDEGDVIIPTIMPTFEANRNYEIINFLLVGHDSETDGEQGGGFRTDSLIVVSINRTAGSVSMLSLPRDLYLYVPNWRSQRLNVVWGHGRATYGGNDGGFRLMQETVLYNFGLHLHYYAMIDFSGFKEIIDGLGGVIMPVDCPIQDYRFTGQYDEAEEPVFELITLDVGLHQMDSITALFYARSRRNSSDFDRGRRQQQLLRAIFGKALATDRFNDMPRLYADLSNILVTNVPLDVMVQLAPLAFTLQPTDIESHFFHLGRETLGWTTPSGAAVQLLQPEPILDLLDAFMTPPTQNQLVREGRRIGIFDSSEAGRYWDVVAADRLVWEGLNPIPLGPSDPPDGIDIADQSIIIDYTGETKGSSVDVLASILNIRPPHIYDRPDADRTVDYAVYLSPTYDSCVDRQVIEPRPAIQ